MTIKHPFSKLTVSFPNGLARTRNCQHTEMPADRKKFSGQVKPYLDVYSNRSYANMLVNIKKVNAPLYKSRITSLGFYDDCEKIWFWAMVINVILLFIIFRLSA